jgi:Fur family ferric uptake transcriptional regulator
MNDKDLKRAGLKITEQRLVILDILKKSKNHHISAEDAYKELIKKDLDVGIATIYRVLAKFEEVGIVNKINFDNNMSVFELANTEHHDHLICTECGNIEEFTDEIIEQHQSDIAKKYNYKLTSHSLNLYGICKNCL